MHLPTTTHAAASHAALEILDDRHDSLALAPPARGAAAAAAGKVADLQLVGRLKALVDAGYKGVLWSRGKLARAIGTNTANVSIYLRQDADRPPVMAFDVVKLEAKVRDFLTTLASKRDFNGGIIGTVVVTRFAGFVDMVRATNEIGFFYGPAGLGKSTAVESYAAGSANALTLTATKWQANAHAMTTLLFGAMKQPVPPRGTSRAEAIANRLKDLQGVIIIDNAHRLTHGAVEFLFDLYDLTNTPLVFVGNRSFMDRLRSDDQLFSRLFHRMEAAFKDPEDKPRGWAIHQAADAILKRELPEHFAELKTMARKVAREAGHLRALVKRCRYAAEIMQFPDFAHRPITDAFLAAHAGSVHTGYSLDEDG